MGCASSTENVDEDEQLGYANAVYYPNWKVYNGKQPNSIELKYVSHIFYAFALYGSPSIDHILTLANIIFFFSPSE